MWFYGKNNTNLLGNPQIGKEFNTKRFINCHDFNSFDEVLARIKEIDTNDELFLQIMNEPIFTDGYSFDIANKGIEQFLKNIVEQPRSEAPRRTINQARAKEMEDHERLISKYVKRQAFRKRILAKLYKPFKKIKILEDLKHAYYKKN